MYLEAVMKQVGDELGGREHANLAAVIKGD
jgi:hypothetical protein